MNCNTQLTSPLITGIVGIVYVLICYFSISFNQAFATNGITTITWIACDDQVTVSIYDIDFGTFSAQDVYATTKINLWTKVWATSTPSNWPEAVYIKATNLCPSDVDRNISIKATYMTSSISWNPFISNTGLFFSGTDTVYLFNWTIPNNTITATSYTSDTDLSDRRPVLIKSSTYNGLAWYYGRLFTHSIKIWVAQPVWLYTWQFLVDCNWC